MIHYILWFIFIGFVLGNAYEFFFAHKHLERVYKRTVEDPEFGRKK